MRRRYFLELIVAGTAASIGAALGIPILLAGLAPALATQRERRWQRLGRVQTFEIGQVHARTIEEANRRWPYRLPGANVYVWRRSEEDVLVLSRRCTDLACPLDYDAGSACYFCPCHGGIFAQDGRRLAGPPLGSMYRYEHRLRDGWLEIDLSSVPLSV